MNENKKKYLIFFGTITIVFLFYFKTIFYSPKSYDEVFALSEYFLPIVKSPEELLEFISLLGLQNHFEAKNTLYSSISSFRCNPFGNLLQMILQMFFQKNTVAYHLYSLILHVINTSILFFILSKVSNIFFKEKKLSRIYLTSILSLVWALHPVNVESVLLLSNANIILSYTLVLFSILIYTNKILENKNLNVVNFILISVFYLAGLFTAEFHFIIPIIVFIYTFFVRRKNEGISNLITSSLKSSLPFFVGSAIFIFSFLISNTKSNISNITSIDLILERIFWFSPQIIFHFIKLIFFPVKLSIDQSLLVEFAQSYFNFYSLFCIFFILIIFIVGIFDFKKQLPFFGLYSSLLLISLIPFSQILAPCYNLASERYLYFPTFILIFSLSHFLFFTISKNSSNIKFIIPTLFAILILFSFRSYFRIEDWKDDNSLYQSAINLDTNPLHRGFRLKSFIKDNAELNSEEIETLNKAYKYFLIARSNLEQKKENNEPKIIKFYGLDKNTIYAKCNLLLINTQFGIDKNIENAILTFKNNINDLSLIDSSGISFYSSLLFFNGNKKEAKDTLRIGLKYHPYSKDLLFPLFDILLNENINEAEKISDIAFKYYPYDGLALASKIILSREKNDLNSFAKYSYAYGLRKKSLEDLNNAYKVYSALGQTSLTNNVQKSINRITNEK